MWTPEDTNYWLNLAERLATQLVDVAEFGFKVDHIAFKERLTDDPRVWVRRGLGEALVKARACLPAGHDFLVYEGWRTWKVQEGLAAGMLKRIRALHPDWSEERLKEEQWMLAPPAQIAPRFTAHRNAGAVDLTIIDPSGTPLDMGAPMHNVDVTTARLLHYEMRDGLSPAEIRARNNRRILIHAMETARFEPYLPEWWHWGYYEDVKALSCGR